MRIKRRGAGSGSTALALASVAWLGGAPVGLGAGQIDELFRPPVGQAGRVSSGSEAGGDERDGMTLASGAEVTLAALVGPGLVTHLWITVDSDDPHWGRNLVLRAFWDGESTASIDTPIGDFFAAGHALAAPIVSELVAVGAEGRAMNCYWPMPFDSSALITLRNDSAFAVRSLVYHVDWRARDEAFPEPLRTFHAAYRQERIAPGSREFVLAEMSGAGHYVGTVLSIAAAEAGWPGEGDDLFYLDGEDTPSLRGTGIDDYFGEAWTFRPSQSAYCGVSIWEGAHAGARSTAYRWHVRDPIPFQKSLRVAFEVRGWAQRPSGWQVVGDRADHFSGVAFWYQGGAHRAYPPMPTPHERLPFEEHRLELENELDRVEVPSGAARPQSRSGRFLAYGGSLVYQPGSPSEAALAVSFEVTVARPYDLVLRAVSGPDSGSFEVYLDGRSLGVTLDLGSPRPVAGEHHLGRRVLAEGTHRIELRAVGGGAPGLELDTLCLRW